MIRIAAVVSLTALLLLVLYLPSGHPPERFMQQLREEHLRTGDFWGRPIAQDILERMLSLQADVQSVSPLPSSSDAPRTDMLERSVAREMAQVNRRLFNSPYFRSIDALLVLASYRMAALMQWLPACGVLALALAVDAFLERAAKAKEFRHHNPELFALYVSIAILTLSACVLAMVWPWTLHPAAWPAAPILVAIVLSRAIAHFHRRP